MRATVFALAGGLVAAAAIAYAASADAERTTRDHATVVAVPVTTSVGRSVPTSAFGAGNARTKLPRRALRSTWNGRLSSAAIGLVALPEGGLFALSTAGEILVVDGAGVDLRGGSVGSPAAPPTVLADGTILYRTNAQNVCGISIGATGDGGANTLLPSISAKPAFCAKVLASRGPGNVAPAATTGGGALFADRDALFVTAGDGTVLARTSAPEGTPAAVAIDGANGYLFSTGAGGELIAYAWPFSGELRRVGGFGGPVEGGVTVARHRAYAVVGGTSVVAMELATGTSVPLVTASSGAFLGAPAVVPGGVVVLLELGNRTNALYFDEKGVEIRRWPLGLSNTQAVDAGADASSVPRNVAHAGPLVEDDGSFAFGTPSGIVGVALADGTVATVADPPCGSAAKPIHLLSGAPGSFYVACSNGDLERISEGN